MLKGGGKTGSTAILKTFYNIDGIIFAKTLPSTDIQGLELA
jgi:hypothetical protein